VTIKGTRCAISPEMRALATSNEFDLDEFVPLISETIGISYAAY
jgi:hypothetical protein